MSTSGMLMVAGAPHRIDKLNVILDPVPDAVGERETQRWNKQQKADRICEETGREQQQTCN